jgi:hypothetical protein
MGLKRKRVVEEFSAFVHETGGQLHRAASFADT